MRADPLFRCTCAALVALAVLTGHTVAGDAPVRVEVSSDFGDQSKWVQAFVADAAKVLVQMMANPDVAPPASIHVELKKDANNAGFGGWARPTAIGFSGGSWPQEKGHLWIVAHEPTNPF